MPLLKKKAVPPPPPPPPPLPQDRTDRNTGTDFNPKTSATPPPIPPLPATFTKQAPLDSTQPQDESLGSTDLFRVSDELTSEANGTASVESFNTMAGGKIEKAKEILESESTSGSKIERANGRIVDEEPSIEDGKKKPKPPSKPSRLKRAFTSGSLTLQRLNKKKKDNRLSMTMEDDVKPEAVDGAGELRDAGLWKLPGMDLSKVKGRNSPPSFKQKKGSPKTSKVSASSIEESNSMLKRELPALPLASGEITPPPLTRNTPRQSKTSHDLETEMKKRELPPLPTEEDTADVFSPIHPEPGQQSEMLDPTPATPSLDRNSVRSDSAVEDSFKHNDSIASSGDSEGTPPPLPARSYLQSSDNSRRASEVAPSVLTLQGALDMYAGCYPLRFRVLQGYCSDTAEINMSTDDVYDIHLVKETKVVTVKSDNGMIHRIPLGSPQKVGIIYNPTHDYEKGLEGYTLKSIADITSSQELPKVICATQEARSSDGKCLVEKHEVLVVRQIHRTLFKGKKGLKVISMATMAEKLLPEDCVGYFSTKPSLVRLHLPEIIEFVPKPFPVRAVMYSAGDSTATADQPEAVTGVVTMVECSTETSLVVSAAPFDESLELIPMDQVDFANSERFDLQLDDDMRALEVAVVQVTEKPEPEPEQLSESESEPQYDDTVIIPNAEEIDEASVSGESDHVYDDTINVIRSQDFVVNSSTGHLNDSQSMLQASAYSDIGRADPIRGNGFEEEDGYDTVGLHLLKQTNSPLRSSGYRSSYNDPFDGNDPRITCWMEDLQTATRGLEERLISLESEKNNSEMTKMQDMLLQLTKRMESVDSQLQTLSTQPPSNTKPASAQDKPDDGVGAAQANDDRTLEEVNKAYLSSLSVKQVCALFEAMSLGQYKDHIERELVSGDVLLECDDEVLKDELGMKSKIQRIRLMKVITGQHSSKDLLKK